MEVDKVWTTPRKMCKPHGSRQAQQSVPPSETQNGTGYEAKVEIQVADRP